MSLQHGRQNQRSAVSKRRQNCTVRGHLHAVPFRRYCHSDGIFVPDQITVSPSSGNPECVRSSLTGVSLLPIAFCSPNRRQLLQHGLIGVAGAVPMLQLPELLAADKARSQTPKS
ncbi:MAG: hypothetical protein ACO3FE_00065, partial [Planctomycetaceae bacterium]